MATVENKFIPLDKSWIIRMGVLDIVNGNNYIKEFLNSQLGLSDDLLALKKAVEEWSSEEIIDVGESGTLYRLLQFASWKLNLNKKFIKHGTLKDRRITNDPNIINLSTRELLKLDSQTSQWATASVLLGNTERISNPPYKLKLSYEAVEHWQQQKQKGENWKPKFDTTIASQAIAFIDLIQNGKTNFQTQQAEDYCFARVFNLITKEEGEQNWPSLLGHESNRIEEMESVIVKAKDNQEITSTDHRVVQAIAMWGLSNKKEIKILYPNAVNKSWPQFWSFIEHAKNL
jgi:hypothetical protein